MSNYLVPAGLAGIFYAVPRAFSIICPPCVVAVPREEIQSIFRDIPSVNPSDPQDRILINLFRKIENVVKDIAVCFVNVRRKIDILSLTHPNLYHFFSTVLHDNLWFSASLISGLWYRNVYSLGHPFSVLGLIGAAIPVTSYAIHGLRSVVYRYLPPRLGRVLAPSSNLLNQKCYSAKIQLLKRARSYIKTGDSADRVWEFLYKEFFAKKELTGYADFKKQFVIFENSIKRTLSWLTIFYPDLQKDQLYQLFFIEDEIPRFLEEDEVLSNIVCPITLCPILDPLEYENHIYERKAISRWLENHHTAPLTRNPVTINDFQFAIDVKHTIDQRLLYLKMQYLVDKLQLPVDLSEGLAEKASSFPNLLKRQFLDFCREYGRFDRQKIPEEFEYDEVLSENVCPITLCAIRHPLRDPTSDHIYEAESITAYVKKYHRSPLSLHVLEVGNLQPCPELEKDIENRLRFLRLC
jgi:hypothetical protein